MDYCFLNGKILSKDEAKVSITDIGLMRGYGIYDGIVVYDGKAFRLQDHIERLRRSAAGLSINIHYSDQQIKEAIDTLVQKNDAPEMVIKVIVTGGETIHGLEFAKDAPTFFILAEEFVRPQADAYEKGAKLITYEHKRFLPQYKTINYIAAVLMQDERKRKGAIDVLFVSDGTILECASSNIFIVKNGVLITPLDDILFGITRKVVIELAHKEGIKVEERLVSIDEMLNANEVFIVSSFKEIVPIVDVDGRKIADGRVGSMSEKLSRLYREYISES